VLTVIALVIILAAIAVVAYPLFRRKGGSLTADGGEEPEDLRLRREKLYEAIRELDLERDVGSVVPAEYEKIRGAYEVQAAALLQEEEERRRRSERQPTRPHQPARTAAANPRPVSSRLGLLIPAAAILVVGVGIGFFLGTSLTSRQEGMGITGNAPGGATGAGASSSLEAANAAFTRGDFRSALEGYKRILGSDPENLEALTQIGVLLARGEHYDEALETFDRVLSLQANYPHALFEKGLVLFQGKVQPREGVKIWEQLIRTAPPDNEYAISATSLIEQVRASMGRPSPSPTAPRSSK
jgi:tetratricopeptide (TPR) repeat protein